ncbi:MAG TPA: VCBS repeat-containing protein, partial [Thermoanaerobaculia bacterium]|nr:VCBS repeat-containing protein [Thermoanaerobaculia bacterium]
MSLTLLVLLLAAAPLAPGRASAEALSALRFRDAAERWGLVFRHHHGGSGERYMVETMVGGVVIFDYDGDGDPDVFFVDGGPLPGYEGEEPRSRLFRNDSGRFVDVTDDSGIEVAAYGSGAVAGDADGDGDLDLYVTAFGPDQLFRNQGDGTFTDATAEAGLGDGAWSVGATFFDPDRDGDLDLYVVRYVDFTLAGHKFCGDAARGLQGYCHPEAYPGLPDRFYRNRGRSSERPWFEDATEAAGLAGPRYAGLGVVAGDLDGDAWPDLYVANDKHPNLLFRNRGDGTFEDHSLLSGTSHGERGEAEAGMGVDLGDVDGDGRLDLVVTNFEVETNALYRNLGGGLFTDARFPSGVAAGSLTMLAFGVALVDFDHDGDLDLVVANGHILDNAPAFSPRSRYAQPNQLYENLGGRFREVAGAGLDAVRVSRGLATGDFDGDGDRDLVIVASNGLA